MATAMQLPDVEVISEGLAPLNGAVAGCGQAAVLMMNHVVTGQKVDANTLLNLIKYSVATGHSVTKSGATTPEQLQWLSEQNGVKTQLGSGASWRSTVDTALASGKPVVVGVSNARAFGGSDSRVSGHYVTVVGTTTDGRYIVADPNQQAAKNGETVIYSPQQIQAARPFATLVPVGTTAGSTSKESGDCQYKLSLFPGNTTCMDPFIDGLIRVGLILSGILLIVIAILIFTAKQAPAIEGDAKQFADVAAVAAA